MNQKEQILKIAEDLSSLGVKPGDVLFTHSSLSSMGKVEGGCETGIRGMEEPSEAKERCCSRRLPSTYAQSRRITFPMKIPAAA